MSEYRGATERRNPGRVGVNPSVARTTYVACRDPATVTTSAVRPSGEITRVTAVSS